MTEILVKIAFGLTIIFIAIYHSVKYLSNKHPEPVQEPTPEEYTKEELDNIKLAEELYNKDLRQVVAKKAPKKEKVEEQVEAMRKVVDAHDTLVKEIAKVTPEVVKEEKPVKSEFPIDKPKKKRKYYPKKKK
jgi:hypothetical protein